ncbi:hypothetical protein Z045_09000 [Rhodococcus pyridinivorans KG-16]|uniref:Uncharacterized protein n=1 Tax=Rhodococcus pyridinivorans KG-16 TaxID=1441730 RepID=A0A0V9UN65_9NOCA|nr:hypothetical protein [Rhodococcus pyridinivorans]KSZ59438.1 hypothetical protein Z045_09000 [Rhodococcus pyridinivorans KG-16]
MNSAWQKFNRAEQHEQELRRHVEEYRSLDPVRFELSHNGADTSARTVELTWTACIDHPIPDAFGLILGDLLTNLRATLDHALYAHAMAHHRSNGSAGEGPKPNKMKYPIRHDEKQWVGDMQRDITPHISSAFFSAMKDQQPFAARGAALRLDVLDNLVNIDKHRTINVVEYGMFDFSETKLSQTEGAVLSPVDLPLRDGEPVAVLRMPRPDGQSMRALPYDGLISFSESIDVLGTRMGLLGVSAALVATTKDALEELQRAAGTDW